MADLDAWFRGEYRISSPIGSGDTDYTEQRDRKYYG